MNGTYVVEIISYEGYYTAPGEHTLSAATAIAAYWRRHLAGSGIAVRIINLAFATRR
jgi:hypothetical protein